MGQSILELENASNQQHSCVEDDDQVRRRADFILCASCRRARSGATSSLACAARFPVLKGHYNYFNARGVLERCTYYWHGSGTRTTGDKDSHEDD
jgi:hypothetical protein